jgi:hypothetical protein
MADTRLTKRQREELERLAGGMQYTYGKGRARVQNTLVRLGLAVHVLGGSRCIITAAGRTFAVAASPPESPPTGKETPR